MCALEFVLWCAMNFSLMPRRSFYRLNLVLGDNYRKFFSLIFFLFLICTKNLRINFLIHFYAYAGDNRMKNDWSRGGGMNLPRMRRPEDQSPTAGLMMEVVRPNFCIISIIVRKWVSNCVCDKMRCGTHSLSIFLVKETPNIICGAIWRAWNISFSRTIRVFYNLILSTNLQGKHLLLFRI